MKKKSSRITKDLLEMAKEMRDAEILDEDSYEKITMRHLGKKNSPKIDPVTSKEIRAMRENAHISQAVFANYLNLTVGYVSQLERGIKKPKGAALALLNVIRRKGLDAIL